MSQNNNEDYKDCCYCILGLLILGIIIYIIYISVVYWYISVPIIILIVLIVANYYYKWNIGTKIFKIEKKKNHFYTGLLFYIGATIYSLLFMFWMELWVIGGIFISLIFYGILFHFFLFRNISSFKKGEQYYWFYIAPILWLITFGIVLQIYNINPSQFQINTSEYREMYNFIFSIMIFCSIIYYDFQITITFLIKKKAQIKDIIKAFKLENLRKNRSERILEKSNSSLRRMRLKKLYRSRDFLIKEYSREMDKPRYSEKMREHLKTMYEKQINLIEETIYYKEVINFINTSEKSIILNTLQSIIHELYLKDVSHLGDSKMVKINLKDLIRNKKFLSNSNDNLIPSRRYYLIQNQFKRNGNTKISTTTSQFEKRIFKYKRNSHIKHNMNIKGSEKNHSRQELIPEFCKKCKWFRDSDSSCRVDEKSGEIYYDFNLNGEEECFEPRKSKKRKENIITQVRKKVKKISTDNAKSANNIYKAQQKFNQEQRNLNEINNSANKKITQAKISEVIKCSRCGYSFLPKELNCPQCGAPEDLINLTKRIFLKKFGIELNDSNFGDYAKRNHQSGDYIFFDVNGITFGTTGVTFIIYKTCRACGKIMDFSQAVNNNQEIEKSLLQFEKSSEFCHKCSTTYSKVEKKIQNIKLRDLHENYLVNNNIISPDQIKDKFHSAYEKYVEKSKDFKKILLAGEGGVGRTTLMRRYLEGQFSAETKMTICVDFFEKTLHLDNRRVDILFIDLAGQERWRFFQDTFFKGIDGAILTFDLTRPITLDSLDNWIYMCRKENPQLPIVLAGFKKDLAEDITAYDDLAQLIKEAYDLIDYFPISCKTGENISQMFDKIFEFAFNPEINNVFIEEMRTENQRKISENALKELNVILREKSFDSRVI